MPGVLKYPLSTEKAIGLVTRGNTIVYIVDHRSAKSAIKGEFERVFNVKVQDIRTENTPNNRKKAYIKLAKGSSAEEVAKKLKLV
ncbi:MAG: 50S ribosomal protein L23 [Candidatus Marsarchaeota archaeon]|nr:50S ribosomal protein L23 [Candidatus Marsarchaeota archaeon]MCL5115285.1 50S ribosomal protein L23 [Candidatus Marsarchaeota archaeon]